MWQSSTAEAADFWNDMGFLWPFFIAFAAHFAATYVESNWIKKKLAHVLLYGPAFLFSCVELTTDLISGPSVMKPWGYEYSTPNTSIFLLSMIWAAILPILAVAACVNYHLKVNNSVKRKQSGFVTIGLAVPVFAFLGTNIVFPMLGIGFPNVGPIAIAFFALFVSYAVKKYELFTFDAALAAENIISTMPDSLALADIQGKMLRVNKRLVDFLGYKEDELKRKPIAKLCAEEKTCMDLLEELTEKRVIRNHELVLKTKSEEEKVVLFSGSVVQSKTGRDIGIMCIIHDITERKEMEERLVKSERLASIGELAGQVGHELRNPLTGIKSGTYFLRKKRNKLTEADMEKVLAMIDSAVEDSNRIISSLLDYSCDLHLEMDRCTPKALLLRTLSKIQVPSGISIQDNTLDEPEMLVDVPRMENIFFSIIQNAIEAIAEKGTIEVRSAKIDSNVEITFTDSGAGIPKSILIRIFSPLTTTKAKGMGLGLATSKRIIEAHGGTIAIESTVGKGTTVTITLPIKPEIQIAVNSDWITTEQPTSAREN
jgi:PAS domain S-box-containing protein